MKHCDKLSDLFAEGVIRLAVMNERDCPSGLMAFGYPEREYGYRTIKPIEYQDIPLLIAMARRRGFALERLYDGANDPTAPEGTTIRSFSYSLPGSKTWLDFAMLHPVGGDT